MKKNILLSFLFFLFTTPVSVFSMEAPLVELFSPQGIAKDTRQVTARFSETMVSFGDPTPDDPFDVSCSEPGKGRWVDGKNWVFDFNRGLPGGVICNFNLKEDLKTLSGKNLEGKKTFTLSTGGPGVISVSPYNNSSINEDQVFILSLDTKPDKKSALEHVSCRVEGINEAIGIRIVSGVDRENILKAYYNNNIHVDEKLLVQCKRRLPNDKKVWLIWGKEVRSLSGVSNRKDQVFTFKSRPTFEARFSCERENPQAGCIPFLPMTVSFSSRASLEAAREISLKGPSKTYKPKINVEPGSKFTWEISFPGPFPEKTYFTLETPQEIKDDAGRDLANIGKFPLKVATASYPPLAKFSSRFGIIEKDDPILPVALRNIEPGVKARVLGGVVNEEKKKVLAEQMEQASISAEAKSHRLSDQVDIINLLRRLPGVGRSRSLLKDREDARSITIPKPGGQNPLEVVGIPLENTGLHVIELESPILGASLLEKPGTMYVLTAALVTNLSAHFKRGRESSLVWVTRLDNGNPEPEATVVIRDCNGKKVWEGVTDDKGIAFITDESFSELETPYCQDDWDEDSYLDYSQLTALKNLGSGLFVFASKGDDLTFVHTSWNNGIEAWNYQLPSAYSENPFIAHTILDRRLLRAGETVHMKHLIRKNNMTGFSFLKKDDLPGIMEIWGPDGQSREFMLQWNTDNGVAVTEWEIPRDAKLGAYEVWLRKRTPKDIKGNGLPGSYYIASGGFRVEEFRIPLMKGTIQQSEKDLVNVLGMDVDLQVSYLSGGGAQGLPVKLRNLAKKKWISPTGYPDFTFANGEINEDSVKADGSEPQTSEKLQTMELALQGGGAARARIAGIPKVSYPQDVQVEMEFRDPNGEVQTVSQKIPVYPSRLLLGIKPDSWAASKEDFKFHIVALDLSGKPAKGVKVEVDLFEKNFLSHRKRLIGGFYSYEHMTETRKIGSFCHGKTGSNGLLVCEVKSPVSGNVILRARAVDDSGNPSVTHREVWIAGRDDWWFGVSDNDRMDLLPEKKKYEPGETATLQVRSPFRNSTALVTVEREGIIEAHVREISGKNPTISIPIKDNYAPNVYVSVLCVRGRAGNFKPTALIDLGKPAFRLGIEEIKVGWKSHELKVNVQTGRKVYGIREKARVRIKVQGADGRPLPPGGEVALAVVDAGLLELAPNNTWELLKSMMTQRPYEVETSTAQTQVVGKRHYGLKALPEGGGGGKFTVRELFDTLLLWKGRIFLNENGEAVAEVLLKDSLTSYKVVAIANAGTGLFGTGSTAIRTTQDLMLLSGLPEIIREGDNFQASFTVRNSSDHTMSVAIETSAKTEKAPIPMAPKYEVLLPGEAREISARLKVPKGIESLEWLISARELGGKGMDALRARQKVLPLHRPKVYQATLARLEESFGISVEIPTDAIPGKGALNLSFRPSLAGAMGGVTDYMKSYPYTCTEQKVSRALVLNDNEMWEKIMAYLPTVIDPDGLLKYFPTAARGSVVLTSYVLAISREAGMEIPARIMGRMESGLEKFIQGKTTRYSSFKVPDLSIRKLSAIEALSSGNKFQPKLLDSITIEPNFWPTSALIDWINILTRRNDIHNRDKMLDEATQVLRSRLNFRGAGMVFSTEKSDNLWWLMVSNDVNAARVVLSLLDSEEWKEDMPRLAQGLMGRQVKGRWDTTTANAWGTVALKKFSAKFESEQVTGKSISSLNNVEKTVEWRSTPQGQSVIFDWPDKKEDLVVSHEGNGNPWVSLQAYAAIPLREPVSSGYAIKKTNSPVEQKRPGNWSVGDVFRVKLEMEAQADMSWVALNDPVPAGATILGGGLGMGSKFLTEKEKGAEWVWPLFEERSFEAFRAYYEYVPKGKWSLEYTIRINNAGAFNLPETRVEALYSPEMFGAIPNEKVVVKD